MNPIPLEGAADNGERVAAEFPFYKGPVGLARGGNGIQAAYIDDKLPTLPATGTLAGIRVTVTAAARSLHSNRFVVLTIAFDEE